MKKAIKKTPKSKKLKKSLPPPATPKKKKGQRKVEQIDLDDSVHRGVASTLLESDNGSSAREADVEERDDELEPEPEVEGDVELELTEDDLDSDDDEPPESELEEIADDESWRDERNMLAALNSPKTRCGNISKRSVKFRCSRRLKRFGFQLKLVPRIVCLPFAKHKSKKVRTQRNIIPLGLTPC